jgi:HlyD family secretion protein
VELVDVGSQVSGKIVSFGMDSNGDEVDYCSEVTNGMVLARIDDVTYLADLEVARAQQVAAAAAVSSAAASLAKARVDAARAARDFERAKKVGVGLALSQSDYDAYQAEAESAEAQVGVAEAASEQAAAQVVQAQANVEKAERNLGYCTIVSPVDGVVIDRRVNLGQTVVSSMSVSSLFLVAKDLRHVRIWASVNEADVGAVRAGQGVSFTVDAFPGRVFRGVVRRVRLNATLSSNVVTYTVEIDVDNPDLVLLPYLTASVEFETEAVRGALVVPSRALRWNPALAGVPPDGMPGKAVWVDCGSNAPPRRVPVRVLLDNGTSAAIEALEGGALSAGSRVVEREEAFAGSSSKSGTGGDSAVSAGSNNPFLSKMPKPPRRGGPR